MKSRNLFLYLAVLLNFYSILLGVVKGSETVVSIEPNVTFPAEDSDNNMLGFGWFKNGFSLADATTTCTFDSVYPVSGNVDLKGGTLYLKQDLLFKNVTNILGWGSIEGNEHQIDLCSTITALPPNTDTFDNADLFFNSDLVVEGAITFKGKCLLHGRGNTLVLGDSAELIIDSNAQLELRDMEIIGINNTNIRCVDDSASIILDSIRWVQDGHYTFDTGSFIFRNPVSLAGTYTFEYASKYTSTIDVNTELLITDGTIFKIGKAEVSGSEPLYFKNQTSELKFNNASWITSATGMQLTRGTVIFDHDVTIEINSTSTGNGLIVGNGIIAQDPTIQFYSGTAVTHKKGHISYNCASANQFQSFSKSARVVRYENSYISIDRSIVLPKITVEIISNAVPPLQMGIGQTITYDNSFVVLPDVEFDINSNQLSAFVYHLFGDDKLFFTKGVLPLYLQVSGSGNQLQGNGGVTGAITLQDSDAELTFDILGRIENNVTLNSGKMILERDLIINGNGLILGPGNVDISTKKLYFNSSSLNYATPINWISSEGGTLNINSKLTLSSTWTINGDCIIDGHNNTLVLADGGEIVVESDSSLQLKNILIQGVGDKNIRCVDDTGEIIWINTKWLLDNDYTFSHGSFKFIKNNQLKGEYSFIYDSPKTSTIRSDAELFITGDVTLQLGRKTVTGAEPIYFDDNTAIMRFDNSTLHVPSTGLQLTRGTVVSMRDVAVEIDSTSTMNGFHLGNGNVADDLTLEFFPGSTNRFNSGHIVYNITSGGIKSKSRTAQFIRGQLSVLNVKNSLTFSNVTSDVNPYSQLIVENNANINYEDAGVILPQGNFILNGTRLNDYTTLLSGNQEIEVANGALPLATLVAGTGNTIKGNGNVTGPIILQSSASSLTINLVGSLFADLTLNGGSIALSNDLNFVNNKALVGAGTIEMGDHNINFGKSDLMLTSSLYLNGTGASVNLQSLVTLKGTWTINGNVSIKGNGNTLNLDTTGEIVVEDGATLTLQNVWLQNVSGNNIRCLGDSAQINLNQVTWLQDDHYSFTVGRFKFIDQVDIAGSYTFIYQSTQASTIAKKSELRVSDDAILRIGQQSNGENPLIFEDKTSTVRFTNMTLQVTDNGLEFATGRVICDRQVDIEMESTSTLNGIKLGNGTAAGDLRLEFIPGSSTRFKNGHTLYNMTQSDGLISRSKTAKIIRDAASQFHIAQDVMVKDITIDAHPSSLFTTDEGKIFYFEDVSIVLPTGEFDIVGARASTIANSLDGDDSIYIARGTFPMLTYVSGTNNVIHGNGAVGGPIIFTDPNGEIIWRLNGAMNHTLALNGGTLNLENDLDFSTNGVITGPGTINLASCNVAFGPKALSFNEDLEWQATSASIALKSKISLNSTWNLNGNITILGNSFTLDLGSVGEIVVAPNSTVIFKDLILQNIKNTNIRCLDDTAVIVLENTQWVQDAHATFTVGALCFRDTVKMRGENKIFAYQTSLTSTIHSDAQLKLDNNFTFSYDPLASPSQNLIEFEDSNAKLILDGANLHATSTGMQLTKGTLFVKRESYISSEVVVADDEVISGGGIIFGNGLSYEDITCRITPGAQLGLRSGLLVYKNVHKNSFITDNKLSLLKLMLNTFLYLYENLHLGEGYAQVSRGAIIESLVPEKTVSGSIEIIKVSA